MSYAYFLFESTHYLTSPEKPMKARLINPAVIIAMDVPLKMPGTSAPSSRSRMPANNTSTSVKPIAPPMPKNSDSMKLCFSYTLSSGMPSTAQLVVISGK